MRSLQTAPLPHRDRCSSISFSTATGRVFAYALQHHCAGVGGVESPTQRASCPAQNRFSHPSSSSSSKPHPIRARICVKVSSQCYDRFVFTSSNPPAQPSTNLPSPAHPPATQTRARLQRENGHGGRFHHVSRRPKSARKQHRRLYRPVAHSRALLIPRCVENTRTRAPFAFLAS